MLYVFQSLPSVLLGLTFGEGYSSDGICDNGEMGSFLYSPGYFLALIIAAGLPSWLRDGDRDDGIYILEEVWFDTFAGDESSQIVSGIWTMMVFQFVDDVTWIGVAVIIEEGDAFFDRNAPQNILAILFS